MSFTVNFHTSDTTTAQVSDLTDEHNSDLVVVWIGTVGDAVAILGTLANLQDAFDEAASQLAKLRLARGEHEWASLGYEPVEASA